MPYYYNPAVISPLAAGIGGGIGGAIAAAIQQGQQRRANRRACLLIRGWRMVEVPAGQSARVQAMTDDQRNAYFNTIVGAAKVDGDITERTSFTQPVDPALAVDGPVNGPTSLYLGKKVDTSAPFALAPGEAAVVIAYRRPGPFTAGRAAAVQFTRYDVAKRDLVYRPRDWKKTGDKTVYDVDAPTRDSKAGIEVQVARVTPGDYVIAATAVGAKIATSSYCFGAPTFHIGAGEIAYVGDLFHSGMRSSSRRCPAGHTPRRRRRSPTPHVWRTRAGRSRQSSPRSRRR